MTLNLIVAADEDDLIGAGNSLPWHIPEDLRYFKARTLGNVVISGRSTHESIVQRIGTALPGRSTVVLSTRALHLSDEVVATSPADALAAARRLKSEKSAADIYVIGGATTYKHFLPFVTDIYLTRVHWKFQGDIYMPREWLKEFALRTASTPRASVGTEVMYTFTHYERSA